MDRLIVIAAAEAPPPAAGDWVIRFAGVPEPGERCPDELPELRDASAELLKQRYGSWLDGWARESGLMDIATWEGGLSWWWFGALSERSPQTSWLIHQLHQLLVLRLALRRWRPKRTVWYDPSAAMRRAAARVAAAEGCALDAVASGPTPRRQRIPYLLVLRLFASLRLLARALVARSLDSGAGTETARTIAFTRFPVLWEAGDGAWRERMYGHLPEALEARGLDVAYAAITSGSALAWLRNAGAWRRVLRRRRIRIVESRATATDLAVAVADAGLWRRYVGWRRDQSARAVAFDGIEVAELVLHAADLNLLDPSLPVNRLIARALPRLLPVLPSARFVIHPFEFQPMERALAVAVPDGLPVVGLQTGVFTSGQIGCLLRREELRERHRGRAAGDARLAPAPDLIAAYGRLPYRIFAAALGADAVVEAGATRYGGLAELAREPPPREEVRHALGLGAPHRYLLLATAALPEEAWPMLRAARAIAAAHSDIFLLVKFHYHLRLEAELAETLAGVADGRWRIFDAHLHRLILAADTVITGASSVAYEALALGRPALVYLSPALFHCNPATETPDAFAFWHTPDELLRLIGSPGAPSAEAASRALADQIESVPNGDGRLIDAMERAAARLGPAPAGGA